MATEKLNEVESHDATQDVAEAQALLKMDGDLAIVSMNNPPYNLIGSELLGSVMSAVQTAVDSGARAVLLNSALKNFSAGADLSLFAAAFDRVDAKAEGTSTEEKPKKDSVKKAEKKTFSATEFLDFMQNTPIPIVAAVRGACLGGGLEIALACDAIIAAKSARLGAVEVSIGVAPIMGGVQRLVERVGIVRAKEFAMLGRRHDAETLEAMGVINLAVADHELADVALNYAQQLANGPTVALRAIKEMANIAANQGIAAADEVMQKTTAPIFKSQDARAGIKSLQTTGPGSAKFKGC